MHNEAQLIQLSIMEATGADVREVARAIGTDRNRLKILMQVRFWGSCFKKDILNLVYLAEYYGLNEVANFASSKLIIGINIEFRNYI